MYVYGHAPARVVLCTMYYVHRTSYIPVVGLLCTMYIVQGTSYKVICTSYKVICTRYKVCTSYDVALLCTFTWYIDVLCTMYSYDVPDGTYIQVQVWIVYTRCTYMYDVHTCTRDEEGERERREEREIHLQHLYIILYVCARACVRAYRYV